MSVGFQRVFWLFDDRKSFRLLNNKQTHTKSNSFHFLKSVLIFNKLQNSDSVLHCTVLNQNQNQKKLYCQVRFYTYKEFVVVMLVHASNDY